jgi:hypothetical protein
MEGLQRQDVRRLIQAKEERDKSYDKEIEIEEIPIIGGVKQVPAGTLIFGKYTLIVDIRRDDKGRDIYPLIIQDTNLRTTDLEIALQNNYGDYYFDITDAKKEKIGDINYLYIKPSVGFWTTVSELKWEGITHYLFPDGLDFFEGTAVNSDYSLYFKNKVGWQNQGEYIKTNRAEGKDCDFVFFPVKATNGVKLYDKSITMSSARNLIDYLGRYAGERPVTVATLLPSDDNIEVFKILSVHLRSVGVKLLLYKKSTKFGIKRS